MNDAYTHHGWDERDVVARLGGDEFGVLCPDVADAATPEAIGRRLRRRRTAPRISPNLHLGVSIGIVFVDDASTRDPDDLLSAADQLLYLVKRAGKHSLALHHLGERD